LFGGGRPKKEKECKRYMIWEGFKRGKENARLELSQGFVLGGKV